MTDKSNAPRPKGRGREKRSCQPVAEAVRFKEYAQQIEWSDALP